MAESHEMKPSAPPLDDLKFQSEFDRKLSLGSTSNSLPTALELPSSTVELTISASNLLNRDTFSKSDPVCILYAQDPVAKIDWVEIDRTECVKNDLNPSWTKKVLLEYRFEERQLLRFKIYDWDGKSQTLDAHDFLGKIECTLGEIVSAPHSKFTTQLQLPSLFSDSKSSSTITLVAEELGTCKKVVNLKVQCQMESKMNSMFSTPTTPCLAISKQLDDGSWVLLHKTENFDRTITLRVSSITSGENMERPLRWQVFHKNQNSKLVGAKLVGEFITNYLDLVEHYRRREPFHIFEPKKKSKVKSQDNLRVGSISMQFLAVENEVTFLDHIKNGLELSVSVAIDFTASNGDPARHTSLHYKHGGIDNPYVLAIKTVGEVIQDYSASKMFPAFGFGAKGFPAGNRVSHCFPINFKQNNPFCEGIDGILSSYHRALKRLKLFGPTCFTPVIREQARIASEDKSGQKYFVLLILTDGMICDPDTTREAIINASNLPMSIIILGIGDEDFTEMEKLDCDGGLLKLRGMKSASRDIVQFVELKKFINYKSINPINPSSKIALAQAILAELPHQVCEWMKYFVR